MQLQIGCLQLHWPTENGVLGNKTKSSFVWEHLAVYCVTEHIYPNFVQTMVNWGRTWHRALMLLLFISNLGVFCKDFWQGFCSADFAPFGSMPNGHYMQPEKYVQYTTEFFFIWFLDVVGYKCNIFPETGPMQWIFGQNSGYWWRGVSAWGKVWMGSPSLKAIDLGIGQSVCLWPGALWQKSNKSCLTHYGLDKWATISQTTFSN